MPSAPPGMPANYKQDDIMVHGLKPGYPGLYEIMLHNPKQLNAVSYYS